MTSIALIMPYFGTWPQWIDLFFDSCISNYDVDFYFYTDCDIPDIKANNLYFQTTTFSNYCEMVSSRLGVDFHPSHPGKLCDLKPFYGFIHQDVLNKYDFWGFGDIDLVFGNIRHFYTEELLNQYDVLSTHFDRISGHFALFRNNEKYRNICFSMRHWKRDLLKEQNCILDEAEFSFRIIPESRIPRWIYAKIWKYFGWTFASKLHYWFIPILFKYCRINNKRIRFVEMNVHPTWTGSSQWRYVNGDSSEKVKCHLWDEGNNEECIYCHFLPYKKSDVWKGSFFNVYPPFSDVRISPQGISF